MKNNFKTNIKLSVIISVYNKFEQLKNILLALNNQIELPYEVIIADDGSSENVEESLFEIINQLKFKLKHVYQEDIGFRLAASRNNGINFSEGDYILFIDQDILFDEYFIKNVKESLKVGEVLKLNACHLDKERSEKISKKINENKNFNYSYVKELLQEEDYKKIEKALRKEKIRNLLFKLKLNKRGAKIVGLGIGCFKEDLMKVNGFDEKYEGWGHEDDDLGNRFYVLGLKVGILKFSNLIVHIWHTMSNNKSNNDNYYKERKKEIFKNKNYKCEYGCKNRLRNEKIIEKVLKF